MRSVPRDFYSFLLLSFVPLPSYAHFAIQTNELARYQVNKPAKNRKPA